MPSKLLHRVFAAALALAFLVVCVGTAPASTIYYLNNPNSDISGYTGPYGTVSVTWNGGDSATITLTALQNGGYQYSFGDGSTLALNVNGGATIDGGLGGITATQWANQSPAAGTSLSAIGSSPPPVDGQGNFNLVIDSDDGYKNTVNSMTFTITASTTGSWTSDASVLVANSFGNFAAGHVFVGNLDGTNTGFTGFSGTIPEPGSLLLLGGLAFGLGGYNGVRRLKNRKPVTV